MTKPNEPRPYQFTIRGLLMLPLAVVVIATTGHWLGAGWAVFVGLVLLLWILHKLTRNMIDVILLLGLLWLLGLSVAALLLRVRW